MDLPRQIQCSCAFHVHVMFMNFIHVILMSCKSHCFHDMHISLTGSFNDSDSFCSFCSKLESEYTALFCSFCSLRFCTYSRYYSQDTNSLYFCIMNILSRKSLRLKNIYFESYFKNLSDDFQNKKSILN